MDLLHRLVNERLYDIVWDRHAKLVSDRHLEWAIIPEARNLGIKMKLVPEFEAHDEMPRCVFTIDYCPPKNKHFEATRKQLDELLFVARRFSHDTVILKGTDKPEHILFDCEYRTKDLPNLILGFLTVSQCLQRNSIVQTKESPSYAYH